ncbi:MAG: hypothetical protein U0414_36990 [Polyangiaceae bacterium]
MRIERSAEIAGLPTTVVEPGADAPLARFVWVLLHGMMMSPDDLSPFAHSLNLPAIALFPRGHVEAFDTSGPKGRAWWRTDPHAREASLEQGPRDFFTFDLPDLPEARQTLDRFLAEVAERWPLPIVLGGFSQGGMLTCSTLLHWGAREAGRAWVRRLRAVVLLSSSRIAGADWTAERLAHFEGLPVFISHGRRDADLAFRAGEALRGALEGAGARVTWVPFDGPHEIPLVVWRALRKFLLDESPREPP